MEDGEPVGRGWGYPTKRMVGFSFSCDFKGKCGSFLGQEPDLTTSCGPCQHDEC